ncbi:MAG: hypothetical protein ABI432_18950, partial [Flavobacteriales bacterium]
PYSGTIFIDPDIISATDPTTLVSVTYTGQGMETVYDYRVGWTTINAFLFDVVWSDGLSCVAMVNPEFGTVEAAQVEAEIYGAACGKVQTCLRVGVHALWIHAGVYSVGGGSNAITIHTGRGQEYIADGILEEAFVHECTHCTLSPMYDAAPGWIAAQQADPNFISTYAHDYAATEDLPESYLPWLAVRYRASRISMADYNTILATIPNRLAFLDALECDLFPIVTDAGIHDATLAPVSFRVFPSPASSWINVRPSRALPNNTRFELLAADGRLVHGTTLIGERIELGTMPAGMYVWRCTADGAPLGTGTIAIE